MEDLFALTLVVAAVSSWLVYRLFLQHQSTFSFWEKLALQRHLATEHANSFHTLDNQQLITASIDGPRSRRGSQELPPPTDNTAFVLSEYSLPVCRSLWRIVEYVLSDFIDFWWIKISDLPYLDNDRELSQ